MNLCACGGSEVKITRGMLLRWSTGVLLALLMGIIVMLSGRSDFSISYPW
jgi:hypothetical protein